MSIIVTIADPLGGTAQMLAAGLLAGYGINARQHPDVLAEMEQAMAEAALETGWAVMREHGLGDVLAAGQPCCPHAEAEVQRQQAAR